MRSRVGLHLHRLDPLSRLWTDGRYFNSTDSLSSIRTYTPSTMLSVCFAASIHFLNRQLGRTALWLVPGRDAQDAKSSLEEPRRAPPPVFL